MSEIDKLHNLGQSIWYDNIERKLIKNGEMEKMISAGEIRGVTSNPSIFQKAIENSTDYDPAIQPMAWSDLSAEEIFFQLAVEDIQDTADLFAQLYESTNGGDGYVSLEVNPKLAYESEKTFIQAKELWEWVNRKNLMIKIPATKAGLLAIRQATAYGINVNVTLIFSVKRYEEVIDAFFLGLEDRLEKKLPLSNIASVASFFVSRVDSKIDSLLEKLYHEDKLSSEDFKDVRGKAAIANSRLAYELYQEKIASERFKKLADAGARMQRPLWASTSTKNPEYYDVIYVEELIGENTVNTMPPQTLKAFKDHGKASLKIKDRMEEARNLFPNLNSLGINIDEVTQILEDEGVSAFAKAFDSLIDTITKKKVKIQNKLGGLSNGIKQYVEILEEKQVINRIYEKDPSFWSTDPSSSDEIQTRLGWLDAPFINQQFLSEIIKLRDEILEEGFTHALLLGMGGSSLAPEVLSLSFRGIADGLHLTILDSTDPRQVETSSTLNPIGKTIYIVSSKSGGTTEVQAFLSYFHNLMKGYAGEKAGSYFIAITDPGTQLAQQAKELSFRKTIYADPTVGGRFSALTAFGLVPAALMGVEIDTFLNKTKESVKYFRPGVSSARNPGLVLGALLAEAYNKAIDKLTVVAEEPFRSFGSWMEQLIAESSGKNGKGIVPIDIEPFVNENQYSKDRLFVYYRNDGIFQSKIDEISSSGLPVITFDLNNPYDLGVEFFRWEFAVAIACGLMEINAFDQPDVQDNKNRTKQKIKDYHENGSFEIEEPKFSFEEANVYGPGSNLSGNNLKEVLINFLSQQRDGDYIAINAYLPRNNIVENDLQEFRKYILTKTQKATTLGFGPRFLHSTGQLHKGGADNGLFIQIIQSSESDLDIPGFDLSFGKLQLAQALGDYEALVARNRRIIRIHLKTGGIENLYK